MGSLKKQLMAQFMSESILLTAFSMIIAVVLAILCLPYFNIIAGKHIDWATFISGPAILIAGLCLFGLAAFMVALRTREIGIRKVLGESVASVLLLVSKEFLLLVSLAFLIAAPLAWWGMRQWLQEFAYRAVISWWIFPAAGAAALFIAVLTIAWQTARAATANPIDSLRSE